MKARVLLLSPPFEKYYMRNARCDFVSLSGTQWFPILLASLGAFLESKGCEVLFIDAPAYNLTHRQVEERYRTYKPDYTVIYPGDKSRDNDILFADRLYDLHPAPAIFVGPYFGIDSRYYLTSSAHVACGVEGEFEYPVWEWIVKHPYGAIDNLVWKDAGSITVNKKRPPLAAGELDAMPFITDFYRRHIDFTYYRTPSEPHPFVDMLVGRGCIWGQCTFCLWVHTYVKGKAYNARSAANVVDEFVFIERELPRVRSVMIQDDTFPKDALEAFCEEKIRRNVRLSWSCYARADLDYKTLALMKEAGCLNIHVGFESASDAVLRRIKKGISRSRMDRFVEDAKKAGLSIHGDFLIGLPGEDEKSTKELIAWACALRPHTAQFQIFIPFRGTAVYRELEKEGCIKDGVFTHPALSQNAMERFAREAYLRFYLHPRYALAALKDPVNLVFKKWKIIQRALYTILYKHPHVR